MTWLFYWILHDWGSLQQNPTDNAKRRFDATLEIVKAIISGVGTVATVIGGVFLFLNFRLAQKKADTDEKQAKNASELAESRLITERFAKAVEQLGSDKIEVRLGAIYSLERIAKDSERDHWTIMEVLTSFIQEKAPLKLEKDLNRAKAYEISQKSGSNSSPEENWNAAVEEIAKQPIAKDIQAALTVIGRRDTEKDPKDPEDKRLDLSNTYLRNAHLSGANLSNTDLMNTNLSRAYLKDVNLMDANLSSANLKNANLMNANLSRAYLNDSDLSSAALIYANLSGAYLSKVSLSDADLSKAILNDANLSGANLSGANLHRAQLKKAKLIDAILKGACLKEACLEESVLYSADVSDADLSNTDLSKANLYCANLSNTDLSKAILHEAPLFMVQISVVLTSVIPTSVI
ncbi:pentapeptide repeat-containing protein [Tumidithrix elongata RA019]|uniref:Pentapeptide repeat-containing protein n=2 Tax=Tumidithrix TaxID=3088355 RepID=A0AAW9Q127_9CYAN|nr:pentapeptide repeat-containing protein [Tumidithrix elongata RA019]